MIRRKNERNQMNHQMNMFHYEEEVEAGLPRVTPRLPIQIISNKKI